MALPKVALKMSEIKVTNSQACNLEVSASAPTKLANMATAQTKSATKIATQKRA